MAVSQDRLGEAFKLKTLCGRLQLSNEQANWLEMRALIKSLSITSLDYSGPDIGLIYNTDEIFRYEGSLKE